MGKSVLKPFKKIMRKKPVPDISARNSFAAFFTTSRLLCAMCAFLLSGTKLVGGSAPLGFAFSAAMLALGKNGFLCAAFAVLGLILRKNAAATALKYITAFIIFALANEKLFAKKAYSPRIVSAAAGAAAAFSGGFMLLGARALGGFPLLYDAVLLVTDAATVYLGTLAFLIAVPVAETLNLRRSLGSEETVALAFLCGGVICGFGTLGFGALFSVSGILCVLSVLSFSLSFGALQGCCAGIVMGLVNCLSRGRIDAAAASFALSGLCAGYFSKKGRAAVCLSFIMTNAVVTVLSNGSSEVLINLFDTMLAAVLLYCMPKKLYNAITGIGNFSHPEALLAAHTLNFTASTIDKCEKSFAKINAVRKEAMPNKLLLYRRCAARICQGCGLRRYCWGRDAAATKASIDTLCRKAENDEPLSEVDSPEHCLRAAQFTSGFEKIYELYQNDCRWSRRTEEIQLAVYSSFSSVAELIRKNAAELCGKAECDCIMGEEVKCALRRNGIAASDVFVTGSGDDTVIKISPEECGGFGRCENAVCGVLEATLGRSFVRTGLRCCGECNHTYVVKPSFSVTAAVCGAVRANSAHSGDCAVYALLDRHTYAIILCDGMGSGDAAREESRLCASLLMRLLIVGLSPESALGMINSMLLCTSGGTLSAIDLCLISLDDGSSRLYKFGGADTYARVGGDVCRINARTVPVGAVVGEDGASFKIKSEKGDIIVLVSDGIASLEKNNDDRINSVIKSYNGSEAHTLARLILDCAKKAGADSADDITVVAAYIG